ncbi:hypothetical protein BG006_005110 [Podila minutissima]|uniref:Uncharacterized protein n=1 Tax=Podila minutissima TaxID=64525 RepID=A0A9P5SKD0_9FUNG|nr:hypothetical protein BG006_005110 [Podila minutissima]
MKLLKEISLPDPFAEEYATSSSSTRTLTSRSTGKRAAARTPQTSNKKRSGITMARDECIGVEESLDGDKPIDEHNDSCDETVVDGLKVTKSTRAKARTLEGGSDNDDDQDNDQDEEDGEGEETIEDLIQELQALKEESEPGVAISGIVDLDVHKDFPQHAALVSECRAAIELQYPKIRDHLQTYRKFVDDDDGLKEARLGELMNQLKGDISRFEDNSDEMVTIEILRILVKQSLPDKYERVKSTETSTLYVWFSIWKLLFSSTAVDVQIGETILKEAQQDQLAAPDTKPLVVKIQHRKNMRLNKSIIMNGCIPRETSTMFLDVVGLEGDWNIITPHGDVILSCQH